nr:hypothetical protein [Tanacetum cinerariifolium]
PEVLIEFLMMIQRNIQAPVITIRTDRGTNFLNKTLNAFFKGKGFKHQTSTARTLEQNGVVKRRNRTLVKAARTMLSASKLPLFFWAEAIATTCYTQNRSIIIPTHDKTTYHIINDRNPSIKHLHSFGCICYLTRDGENLDKMKEKGDLCILVGNSTQSKGYHVYNKRTRLIVESIHIRFEEIKEMLETSVANDTSGVVPQRQKASDYDNSDLVPQLQNVSSSANAHVSSQQEYNLLFEMSKTSVANDTSSLVPKRQKALDYDNSDLVPQLQNVSSLADAQIPSQQELDLLFGPLYDEFFTTGTSSVNKSFSPTNNSNQQDTQPTTNIQPTSEPSTPTYVHAEENNDNQAEEEHLQDDEFTNPLYKDHPLEQIRRNLSKPVQTRRQLATDPEMCMLALTVNTAEPKNIKEAMADSAWIEAKQEELHQF